MKIGFCTSMIATDYAGIGDEHIQMLARLGYDYVELPLSQMMALSDAEFEQRVKRPLSASNIGCAACNNFFPATLRLTGPSADHPSAIEYAKRAFERARSIGSSRVVFGSGGARNLPDGFPAEQGFDQLTALLRAIAGAASDNGIVIAIEHLNRLESNIINRFIDGLELISAVNERAVMALCDWYHMALGFEDVSHINQARGRLAHAHIARTLGRGLPAEGDMEPYGALAEAFRAISYDQCVSVEAVVKGDIESGARETLKLLRGYFN